ncbi:MAG: hypothetical protein ACE5K4_06610 [Candidatus Hydrothermarchaeota archaeon]
MDREYAIPDDRIIEKTLIEIMRRHKLIETQKELGRQVKKIIKEKNPKYRVSEERIKKIAALSPEIGIRVEMRRSKRKILRCPCCKGELKEREIPNLFGGTSSLKKCERCNFEILKDDKVPRKYSFMIR